MKTVLTVAGSDPSGGAGIQADIKTITAHGLYATSAITALTVQNTLVIDPVMISTSGHRLLDQEAVQWMKRKLFPMAQLITPNLPEAEALCGMRVRDEAEMERAARLLSDQTGAAVLLKGGHLAKTADDLLLQNGEAHWLQGRRVENSNTHGTGCTLSSAIACGLARGQSLVESARAAKEYLTNALRAGLDLGAGNGPLNHMFQQTS